MHSSDAQLIISQRHHYPFHGRLPKFNRTSHAAGHNGYNLPEKKCNWQIITMCNITKTYLNIAEVDTRSCWNTAYQYLGVQFAPYAVTSSKLCLKLELFTCSMSMGDSKTCEKERIENFVKSIHSHLNNTEEIQLSLWEDTLDQHWHSYGLTTISR